MFALHQEIRNSQFQGKAVTGYLDKDIKRVQNRVSSSNKWGQKTDK